MTIVAGVTAANVSRIFAGRDIAVVTRAASPDDLRMVYRKHGCEHIRVVTILANCGGQNMRGVLADGFSAIVAARTVVADIDMIEIRRYPACGRMTIVTVVAAVDMGRVLSDRRNSVMTRTATAQNLGMVDRKHGREHIGIVTVFTHVGGKCV